jgi:hypothetical protein
MTLFKKRTYFNRKQIDPSWKPKTNQFARSQLLLEGEGEGETSYHNTKYFKFTDKDCQMA